MNVCHLNTNDERCLVISGKDIIVDLMDGTGMQQEPVGVTATENRCRRNDTIAYDIAESALLTINTNTLFPNGIARDFSILVVAKPKVGQYSLQSIYIY